MEVLIHRKIPATFSRIFNKDDLSVLVLVLSCAVNR